MPVPTSISDLSTTAAANSPAGSESPAILDDIQRAHGAFIRQISDASVTLTGTQTITGAKTFQGGFTISGTAARISGDFSNATLASRVIFQTSTTNAATSIGAMPNGTSTQSDFAAYGGTDPANAPITVIRNTGTEAQVLATRSGAGAFVPMTFYAGAVERVRIGTDGNVGIGRTSGTVTRLTVKGSGNSNSTFGITVMDSDENVVFQARDDGLFTVNKAAGLGYGTGAGGTVTQATSKSTSVTLNKPTGQITMHNAALAAGASVQFNLNNTLISGGAGDIVLVNQFPSIDSSKYEVWASPGTGVAQINVRNRTGGSLSEALVINFAILKGATS